MTTTASTRSDLQPLTPASALLNSVRHVWGLDARSLHDRWWASKGVQVVRPGGEEVVASGPSVYLLLDADDLVVLGLQQAMRRMNWMKPRAMRLRLVDASAIRYVERALSDEDGRFLAVERQYRPTTRSTRRAAITGEAKLAKIWKDAASGREGWRSIVQVAGRQRTSVCACQARIFSVRSQDDRDQCASLILDKWKSPGSALDGVYEFQTGVWVHESVRTPEGLRCVAPVWVGQGVQLSEGDVVIGPRIICDEKSQSRPAPPVRWSDVRYPGWRPVRRLRGRWFRVSKRLFDIAFSAMVLLVTSPVYPIAMLAILIEDGWPFFFAHRRQTLRGREFPCYKFRTMCRGADRMKSELAAENACDGPQFFIENDPRLLRSGKLLRRLQIDELPQFLNVLLGHMSVVGPRPSPDSENQCCPAWREARLSVRPGVTGLWQVRRTREPETDFQEWIRYDLEYVQHESWRLDIWIILRTIEKVIKG